jgi:simple sugar transport system permease protein
MALLFGFFDGLGFALQNTFIPSQFTQMVPYLATLVALYFYSKKKKVESKEDLEDESMAV